MQYSRLERPIEKSKKKRYMPLTAGALCALYVAAVLLWPLSAIQAKALMVHSPAPVGTRIAWPAYGQSAIGTVNRGVLATSPSANQSLPMASITKTLTTLVTLQAKPIAEGTAGPIVTMTAADQALYNQYVSKGGSVARADSGLQLTEYQLIQGMLIASANNYADTLVSWAFGSTDAYLAAAKTYIASHNLSHTTVMDASGFSPGSQSSAADLVMLGRLALQNSVIASVVSQQSAVIPGVGTLNTTNKILGSNGVIGIKTGTTDEAGACLLFAANILIDGQKETLIGAILGAPTHQSVFSDAQALLASTETSFKKVTVSSPRTSYALYQTPWGTHSTAFTNSETSLVKWNSDQVQTILQSPPLKPGSNYNGTVTFRAGGHSKKAQLVLDQNLQPPSLQWRLLHPQEILPI
jgi:D-alanyl-D-alanine carboxypeptidase (penicillin-binding protein 5/6)